MDLLDPQSWNLLSIHFAVVTPPVEVPPPDPHFWDRLLKGFLGTLLFGAIGIILGALSFKVFDWVTPHLDVEKELAEKQNIAVAIVCAAMILGICYIVATAVH